MKLRLVQDEYSGNLRIQQFSRLFGSPGTWMHLDELDLKGLKLPVEYPPLQITRAQADFKKVQDILKSKTIVLEEVDL